MMGSAGKGRRRSAGAGGLGHAWISLAVYLALTTAWAAAIMRKYRVRRGEAP